MILTCDLSHTERASGPGVKKNKNKDRKKERKIPQKQVEYWGGRLAPALYINVNMWHLVEKTSATLPTYGKKSQHPPAGGRKTKLHKREKWKVRCYVSGLPRRQRGRRSSWTEDVTFNHTEPPTPPPPIVKLCLWVKQLVWTTLDYYQNNNT